MTYDLILRNGSLVDGTGQPALAADVAIRAERIARIGDLGQSEAVREIDVTGLIVAPGFIDVHAHDDAALIARPQMLAKLTQGVTTVIAGNCGISGAPYSQPGAPPGLLRLVFKSEQFVAPTFAAYLQKVCDAEPALNAGFLTGHATLRMQVMGEDLMRVATESEIVRMRELLAECLKEGSLGLSTGLFYPPARAASTEEIVKVAEPLHRYKGLYVTHLRDEADGIVESLKEGLQIGREVGVPVVISHHKCMGRKNFGRSTETLALLEQAQKRQSVGWDVYPYTAGSSMLHTELVELASKTRITWCDPYPELCGRDLEEIAQMWGCTPLDAVPKLQPAGALYFMMDEADVTRILSSPYAMIGSDGLPEDQHPHPRLWGTFPRILGRYVRERQVLSLEDAVYRMTGLSAQRFELQHRGTLQVGHYADVCVFDPESIVDTATFERPVSAAHGIRYVLVNGQVALEDGVPTAARAGKVLRRHDFVGLH